MSGRSNDGGLIGNLPTSVKIAAVGLLIHQLMKYRRSEQPAAEAPRDAGGGGLGGILGGLFGDGSPAPRRAEAPAHPLPGPASAPPPEGGLRGLLVGPVLGGLGGMLDSLRGQGMRQQVDSWVQPGQNQPVSPQELERAFAPGELDEAARRAGTDRATLLRELSRMLPEVVDRMTPQGRLPQREEEIGGGGLGGLLGQWMGGGDRGTPPRR